MKRTKDSLVATCDNRWKYRILDRDGWHCVRCGQTIRLTAHHFVTRSSWRFRWELNNGIAACGHCHGRPKKLMVWLEENRPEQFAWVEAAKRSRLAGEKGEPVNLQKIYSRLLSA